MEKKARKDSEYWAGRFKAIREDMDKDLAAGVGGIQLHRLN